MYARYKSHDDSTWSYLEDTLRRVHTSKDVLSLGRASQKVKVKVNALTMKLWKKRRVDEETNVETTTLSKKRCDMKACRDYISHKIVGCKELDADFNYPKIHLMCHWVEQIRQ